MNIELDRYNRIRVSRVFSVGLRRWVFWKVFWIKLICVIFKFVLRKGIYIRFLNFFVRLVLLFLFYR